MFYCILAHGNIVGIKTTDVVFRGMDLLWGISSNPASARPRPHSATHPMNPRGQPNGLHGQESYPVANVGKPPSSAVLLSPIHHR